ncbi:MAG: cytochrome c3 family protein [Myxococcales bacterium]|nr:cytochrome c3 family protein [Myxococcales bacterium]
MQIFPRELNLLPLVLGVASTLASIAVIGVVWYYFSPANLQVGYEPHQPIPYSHRLHVGQLGLDCRYCHSQIERSHEAMIPPTQTCMGCHDIVRKDSPALAPLRASWATNDPVPWVRVHKLPGHVYFDHSAHLAAGVGCVTCHGRIDRMDVVHVDQPISMEWCLDCHRNPAPNLRPPSEITNMTWQPDKTWVATADSVNPPTNCSGCHR